MPFFLRYSRHEMMTPNFRNFKDFDLNFQPNLLQFGILDSKWVV